MALAALCVIVSLVVVLAVSRKPAYGVLYSDLLDTDAATIVAKLKETAVPYTLSADGKTIEVPVGQIPELRITLASEGFPQGGGVGYEIFDKSSFGQTDFTQRINYLRALQGELERMIRGLSPVQNARVILQIPEESIYLDDPVKPPTASVVVKLKLGAEFTRAEVKGIRRLVANSVSGMDPTNVTMVDVTGKILADAPEPEQESVASTLSLQAAQEQRIRSSIEALLAEALGEGRAVVCVSAEMDRDSVERSTETFQPLPGTSAGVVRTQSRRAQGSAATTPGGGVGLSANDGTGAAGGQLSIGADGNGAAESVTNYEISHQQEKVVRGPGGIRRLSVSVFVDSVDPTRLATIRQVVSTAAGIDVTRGDVVAVESMEFPTDAIAKVPAKRPAVGKASDTLLGLPGLYVGAGAGAIVALILVFALLRKRRKSKRSLTGVETGAGTTEVAAGLDELVMDPAVEAPTMEPLGSPFGPVVEHDSRVFDAIEEQIKADAGAAALIIRGWMTEED